MLVWLIISLLVIFRCRLYNIQSSGAFDLIAFIFKMSRLCIKPFIPDVIHGELRARTRFVLSGACLLAYVSCSGPSAPLGLQCHVA